MNVQLTQCGMRLQPGYRSGTGTSECTLCPDEGQVSATLELPVFTLSGQAIGVSIAILLAVAFVGFIL
jgi:hypothetical protein